MAESMVRFKIVSTVKHSTLSALSVSANTAQRTHLAVILHKLLRLLLVLLFSLPICCMLLLWNLLGVQHLQATAKAGKYPNNIRAK
jgi:hypothetical protein